MTTTASAYANAPDLSTDDYVLVGVSTCFVRDDGEVKEVKVLEPIPSAAALTILESPIPTSYRIAYGTTLGAVLRDGVPQGLAEFPGDAQFCVDFEERAFAAARTHRRDPRVVEQVPVGSAYDGFNYSTERKRVLNESHTVRPEDNVKQHAHTHQVL
ncbi:hypothetical protein [Prochlorothrix hollandica]|uniref:hypothetical protein n=1 Tax=Prochlorothrix hollandica TaxID=1223 RepID=UPI00333FA777